MMVSRAAQKLKKWWCSGADFLICENYMLWSENLGLKMGGLNNDTYPICTYMEVPPPPPPPPPGCRVLQVTCYTQGYGVLQTCCSNTRLWNLTSLFFNHKALESIYTRLRNLASLLLYTQGYLGSLQACCLYTRLQSLASGSLYTRLWSLANLLFIYKVVESCKLVVFTQGLRILGSCFAVYAQGY